MKKYAIVGFGCAGYHGARAIRQTDPAGQIVVYSDHGQPPFNPMLTTYYAGDVLRLSAAFPFGTLPEIKRSLALTLHTHSRVRQVLAAEKTIVLEDGTAEGGFDAILIATGASALVPGPLRQGGGRFFVIRTLEDTQLLRQSLEEEPVRRAVVVGASMVGIKVVEHFANAGIATKLVDMAPYLFPLAAYPEVGDELRRRIESIKPVKMLFGAGLNSLSPADGGGVQVHLSDGSVEQADLLVLCIGTRAATSLVDPAQIRVGRGIVVNTRMETSCPGVYAAGDCCEGLNLQSDETQIIGLWANAAKQGRTAGASMAGGDAVHYGNILHNITHFMDIDFIGLGDNRLMGEVVEFGSLNHGLYIKAVVKDGRLAGVNILDNYRISGMLKNYFVRLLEGRTSEIVSLQRGILQKEGLTQRFINELEGRLI